MNTPHRFDDIKVDDLVAQGSMKWTRNPGHLSAFVAEMDFGTAPVITQALHRAVDSAQLGYLPPAIKEDMAHATSEYLLARYQWDIPTEQIYPTADVLSAYSVVVEKFSPPGASVILPTPAYMPFLTLTPALGRKIIQVPMISGPGGRQDMDLDAIATAFSEGAEVFILCNPHNPLGRVYTREELEALAEVVEAHKGLVFADEIHAPLTFGDHHHIPYASLSTITANHTVTATSASKAFNIPGLKCAQLIVSSAAHQEALKDVAFMVSHGSATPGVIANTVAYRSGDAWLAEVLDYININRTLLRDLLAEHIPEMRYTAPEGTYIAWLDATGLPDIKGERSWAEFFSEEAQVALTDGALCGDAGVGHLRLMLATPHHILEKIVKAMAEALHRLKV
jgi:cystathionine beta-lyase